VLTSCPENGLFASVLALVRVVEGANNGFGFYMLILACLF